MCQCLTVLLTLLVTGSSISLLLGLVFPHIVSGGNEKVLELITGKRTVSKGEMEETERQLKQLAWIMALITVHLSIVAYLMICVAKIPFSLPLPC
jgi:hypothetical protein